MNNLTKALAVVSLLIPVDGLPLSIGDIELHSTLNQHLKAEIGLRLDNGENPADISVRLAAPEKFDQAGVPWNYFLSKIKFETVTEKNGSVVIKVSSRETLTEPFLDFLLEVTWPGGKQFREFTLLIDPPDGYNQPKTPALPNNNWAVEPDSQVERPIPKPRPAIVRSKTAETGNPAAAGSGEFGPTNESSTLWSIAKQLSDERGVDTKQFMHSIFKANPDAFIKNDINSLKRGVYLKIPDSNGTVTHALAKQPEIPSTQKPVRKPANLENGNHLKLLPPIESKIADNAIASAQVKPAATPPSEADSKALELQSRIEKLEEQLDSMQKLLSLKDQQLANLQNAAKPAANAPIAQAPEQPAPVNQAPANQAQPSLPAQNIVEPAKIQAPPAQPPAVQTPTPPKPVTKVQPPQPVANEDFFSSDLYTAILAFLGTVLVSTLGWLFWRKRSIQAQTNTESMFARASQITMPDQENNISVPILDTVYDTSTVGESSFISDFTPSNFEDFDTDQSEVDPLSEADVYLAYGRYQQAEELIRNVMEQEPNKDTLKLKLLEIFYASENKQAFADYVEELKIQGKQTDTPFWNKVSEMAAEILPSSSLISSSSNFAEMHEAVNSVKTDANLVAEKTVFDPEDESIDIADLTAEVMDFENAEKITSDLPKPEPLPEFTETKRENDTLNVDSAASFIETEKPKSEYSLESTDIEGFDFDKNSLSLEENGLDFDTRSSADKPLDTASDDNLKESLESFDFNLESFDFDAKTPDGDKPNIKSLAEDIETHEFNLGSDAFSEEDLTDAGNTLDFEQETAKADFGQKADEQILDTETEESSEFDFKSFSFDEDVEKSVVVEPAKPHPIESFDFNFDLDPMDADVSDAKLDPTRSQYKSESSENEADREFEFNFDFDTPVKDNKENEDFDLSVSDLTDMDEYETKIDLAKAYVDMGDAEAARSIAEEVLKKGSKQQQLTAQALLDELK